jgi:regulator of protease activity HflC (stomatin/prohibitin superfamily)
MRRGRRVTVNHWEKGLLFHHGRLEVEVGPGPLRRWGAGFTVRIVDMRPWIVQVPTQEIPTSDGATVKVTVAGQAHVAEVATYVTANRAPEQALYLAVQIALRELVAATTIEDLVANRGDTGGRLLAGLRGVEELGIAVDQLEVKDIVLPGELKRAQTEVLVARAQGASALERARGETAALRAMANAARIAADNPALLQLRLLQQLENSTGHTVVIGVPPLGSAGTSSGFVPGSSGPTPTEPENRSGS